MGMNILGLVGLPLGPLGLACLAMALWRDARRCSCADDPAGWVPGMTDAAPPPPTRHRRRRRGRIMPAWCPATAQPMGRRR